MENLPVEMIKEILSRLDKPSLFQASNTCKLWRKQALTHVVAISDGRQLTAAARNGDRLSIIRSSLDTILMNSDRSAGIEYTYNHMLDWGLVGACEGNHKELIALMINKGAAGCICGRLLEEH